MTSEGDVRRELEHLREELRLWWEIDAVRLELERLTAENTALRKREHELSNGRGKRVRGLDDEL